MSKWKFKATFLRDVSAWLHPEMVFKKGTTWELDGFYYNSGGMVCLVRKQARMRIVEIPSDAMSIEVERDFAKLKRGVKWGVWMEKEGDLPEGWWNGSGRRQNDMFYRTENTEDASTYDFEEDAFEQVREFNGLGYKCEVRRLP